MARMRAGLACAVSVAAVVLMGCGSSDKTEPARDCPVPPELAETEQNGAPSEPTAYVNGKTPGDEWLELLGVLRQPGTPEDRLPVTKHQPQAWVEAVYADRVRRVGPRGGGRRYYVVPGMSANEVAYACREGRVPRPGVALWSAPGDRGVVRGTIGSIPGTTPEEFDKNGISTFSGNAHNTASTATGLMPDGVTAVVFRDPPREWRAPVRDNFFVVELPLSADDAVLLKMERVD